MTIVRLPTVGDKVVFVKPPWNEESADLQSMREELGDDHLAVQIDQLVDQLDLSELLRTYGRTGSPAYDPQTMLKIVLYELRVGRPKPTQWAKDLRENAPIRWLARGIRPAQSRLYAFRDRIAPFIDGWNEQVLEYAIEKGLTDGSQVSLDGSAVAANASRHKLVSERTLNCRLEELEAACGADEQAEPPPEVPRWMAKSPSGRQTQRHRHRKAGKRMSVLQERNEKRRSDKRKDREKVQVSVSDPDAVLGRDKLKTFRPLYTVQIVNDLNSPLVLGHEVFAEATDHGAAETMLNRMVQLTGRKPTELLIDSAYATPQDLEMYDLAGVIAFAPFQENSFTASKKAKKEKEGPTRIEKSAFQWSPDEQAYVCPEGHFLRFDAKTSKQRTCGETVKLDIYRCNPEHCTTCTLKERCTTVPEKGRTVRRHELEDYVIQLRDRMATPEAKELYKRRASTVERIFADMKEHRGASRFSGRGLQKAKAQIGLTVLVHNLVTVSALEKARSAECYTENAEKIAA